MKYQRFTTFGCKDIEVRKSEFVTKTKFLWTKCSLLQNGFAVVRQYEQNVQFLEIYSTGFLIKIKSFQQNKCVNVSIKKYCERKLFNNVFINV